MRRVGRFGGIGLSHVKTPLPPLYLSPFASIVVSGNPLVNSASMINDAKGSGKEPNSEFFVVLAIAIDGTSELHVLSQTTRLALSSWWNMETAIGKLG